jgi:hypothetical protein
LLEAREANRQSSAMFCSVRLDDTYIEKAWQYAETREIEDLAAALLGKAEKGQSIEDDLFCILYLAFRCGFKTAVANNRISAGE